MRKLFSLYQVEKSLLLNGCFVFHSKLSDQSDGTYFSVCTTHPCIDAPLIQWLNSEKILFNRILLKSISAIIEERKLKRSSTRLSELILEGCANG